MRVIGPAMLIVIPLEGRPWLAATANEAERARMIDWAAAQADADPDARALMDAAIAFLRSRT